MDERNKKKKGVLCAYDNGKKLARQVKDPGKSLAVRSHYCVPAEYLVVHRLDAGICCLNAVHYSHPLLPETSTSLTVSSILHRYDRGCCLWPSTDVGEGVCQCHRVGLA